jgi:hypothetical protein
MPIEMSRLLNSKTMGFKVKNVERSWLNSVAHPSVYEVARKAS